MKIDLQRVDDLNARLTIVIEPADYAPKLDENIKNYSKKMNLKGFRSGKTPKSVLTKMYGKGMLEESVTAILNDKLFKYLEEEKIDIFGSPMIAEGSRPVDFNPKTSQDYTFSFDLGIKPSFSLVYKIEDPIEVISVETDQANMEKEIMHYRRVFGTEEKIGEGVIEESDRVEIRLAKRTEEGVEEEASVETIIDLNRVKGSAITILPGQSVGSTFDVDLVEFLDMTRAAVIKNILKLESDPNPDQPLRYKVEVTSIFRPQSTELTGEQISKFVGQQIEDEAGFRRILEEREKNSNTTRTNDMKKMTVRLALLKLNPFEIPEEFLLNWVNSQRDQTLEPGSKEAKNLFREARWSLLLNRISADAKLEVIDKDIQKQVTKWVMENVNYMQTDIRKLMKELYENEYFMSTMKENALEEVVFSHIIPQTEFNEKQGTPQEFEQAFHDLHHELFDHGDHSHDE